MGMSAQDLKRETGIPTTLFNKAIKTLQGKQMVKKVKNFENKTRKHYMAAEFQPSKEITGGAFYDKGELDASFIELVKERLVKITYDQKVASFEEISSALSMSKHLNINLTVNELEQILGALVLDNEILKMVSNGMGEFVGIKAGKDCYKCCKRGSRGEPSLAPTASIPQNAGSCSYTVSITTQGFRSSCIPWAMDDYVSMLNPFC